MTRLAILSHAKQGSVTASISRPLTSQHYTELPCLGSHLLAKVAVKVPMRVARGRLMLVGFKKPEAIVGTAFRCRAGAWSFGGLRFRGV